MMYPDTISVSIIIVSYNTRDLTLACLESVYRETKDIRFEVIVLDNDSSDGSGEAIRTSFPSVHLIQSSENLGFAKGNNVAAREANGTYLLLLNPDTVVLDDAIQKLLLFAEAHTEAGIWGGQTWFEDGTLNPTSCWRKINLWSLFCIASGLTATFAKSGLFNWEGYGGWARNTERHVDIVTGCFFLIRNSDWISFRGFDLTFFMYGEEADLCLRAAKEGFAPMVTPDAKIVHHGGASESTVARSIHNIIVARSILIEKHWPNWMQPLGAMMLWFWPASRWLLFKGFGWAGIDEKTGAKHSVWQEVWLRRSNWKAGKYWN